MNCAICQTEAQLCESIFVNGIKQPRICVECLTSNPNGLIIDNVWIDQLREAGDHKSLHELGVD